MTLLSPLVMMQLRPGFVRVAFPYHLPRRDFEFVIHAVQWVADNGARMLSQYVPRTDTGEWEHRAGAGFGYVIVFRWRFRVNLKRYALRVMVCRLLYHPIDNCGPGL